MNYIYCARQYKQIVIWINNKDLCPTKYEYNINTDNINIFTGTNLKSIIKKNKISELYFNGFDVEVINVAKDLSYKIGIFDNFISSVTKFGEGNSRIIYDVLPNNSELLDFNNIKNEITWNVMFQKGNFIPRLIAIQSLRNQDLSLPIYRHPFDQQPQHKNKNLHLEKEYVYLKHNSLFVLDLETNKMWTHGIKSDKRPNNIKDLDELSFNGQRISFTFRTISTYILPNKKLFGQGARKDNNDEDDTIELVNAFSNENHEYDFNWEENYGHGFNCCDFKLINN